MIVLGLVGLIAGIILFMPLRLIIPAGPLSAKDVTGTIWSGWVLGTQMGPLSLGDLHMGLRWPGVLRVSVPGTDPDKLRASIGANGNAGVAISQMSGRLPLDIGFGALTIRELEFRNANAKIGASGCEAASGRMIATAGVSLPVPVPPLSMGGTLQCRGKDLVASLKSQSGLESLDFSAFPNGAWQARVTVKPTSPDLAAVLLSNGFQETPLGYVRTEQGGLAG